MLGYDEFRIFGPDADGMVAFSFQEKGGRSRTTLMPQADADREIERYLERRWARRARNPAFS